MSKAAAASGTTISCPPNPRTAAVAGTNRALTEFSVLDETNFGAWAAAYGAAVEPPMHQAPLAVAIQGNGPREHWMRAKIGSDGAVTPYGDQDSSLVSVFAGADALLRRRAGAAAASAGEKVDILRLVRG